MRPGLPPRKRGGPIRKVVRAERFFAFARDIWLTPPRQKGSHQPMVKQGFTSRIGIDATSKFKEVEFPEKNMVSRELTQKVLRRWKELGLE